MRHSAGTWSGKTSEVPRFPEGPSGKRHPILGPKSGIRFPAGMKKPPRLVWLRRLYSLRRIVFGSLR